ncbi:MAG: hypothetical protein EU549_05220 [Promethearchaeota archaeon]|nr:MAG: hypothetical protein EU549_05220 [Candidatus Lokiarchaeota archaeon]
MDDSIFDPEGVAIIGASPGYFSGGSSFLQSLIAADFPKEKIFPINPKYDEINGIKAYKDILSVPKPVDYCIIAVPKEYAFDALKGCVKKQVKLVCCFTSGFSEIGNDEDENRLGEIAKDGDVRLLGPNCIGICVPKIGLTFNQGIKAGPQWDGDVSIISQSGGNADAFIINGTGIGLKFEKAVSYGNGVDINADEILEYFKNDSETKLIIQYLEGFKTLDQGRRYLKILRETTPKKPVLVWNGGLTPVGKRSIMSHTGSISGDNKVIKAAFKQSGAIFVENGGRDLLYTALAISYLKKTNKFKKIGLNIGSILGGGGNNVYFADLCSEIGLNFPDFDQDTLEKLKNNVGEVGTLLRNPIDLNVKMFSMKHVVKVMKILDDLDYIDVITFEPGLDWGIMNLELMQKINPNSDIDFLNMLEANIKTLVRNVKKTKKPVLILSAQTFCDPDIVSKRNEFENKFRMANIPVFNTIETMAYSIVYINQYKDFLKSL